MSTNKVNLFEQVSGINWADLANDVILVYSEDDNEWQCYPKSFLATANHNHSYIPTDGWVIAATWTRTGNHTFTTAGDVTATYRPGTKIRYKDGGSYEYGVVASSSHSGGTTTVNLIPNTDYAMANTTITEPYISHIENPEGFPAWFTWDPAPQGFSVLPTATAYRWVCLGRLITLTYIEGTNGTSNATTFTASAPVAAAQSAAVPLGATVDNGTLQTTPGRATLASGSTTITLRKDSANGAWTNTNGKRAIFQIAYEF